MAGHTEIWLFNDLSREIGVDFDKLRIEFLKAVVPIGILWQFELK